MNNKLALFGGAIVVAVICLAISIYYIIPGYDHLFISGSVANQSHPKHALAFFALAAICVILALVTRPKRGKQETQA